MSSSDQSFLMKLPSLDQLKSVATAHHLNISDEDLKAYQEHINKILTEYSELDKYPDECLPVKYRSPAGYPRAPDNNPYNAWTCLTNTQGAASGKLLGKTVCIKDNIMMAGVPLSNGSQFMEGYVPGYNATVVDRVLDAGGIIKGKAQCDNMCFTGTSYSSHPAPVHNPYDHTRTSGGSSSGSGALVASGEVDLSIGTDHAGSIRIPASCCGIVGLKPTHGLIPHTGTVSLDATMEDLGPMARTVRDCALFLEVLAGSDGLDPRQPTTLPSKNYAELLTGEVKGLRVGLWKEGFDGCESDVSELVHSVAQKLTQRGAKVTDFSSALQRQAGLVTDPIFYGGCYRSLTNGVVTPLITRGFKDVVIHDFFFNSMQRKADLLPPGIKAVLLMNGYLKQNYGNHFHAKATNAIRSIEAGYEKLFETYDVVIMPTLKRKAHKLPTSKLSVKEFLADHFSNAANTIAFNATGNPAVSVNAGFSEGLPVGMMIAGRHWEDDLVLNVAYAVEQIRDTK